MTQDEMEQLLQALGASAERQEARLDRLTTLQEIATERLGKAEETLTQMKQQLDRTDATHAGISRTLARWATTQEAQTAVLRALQTTLDRWMDRQANGH